MLEAPQEALGYLCNDVPICVDLTQGKFVVILVVEHVEEITIERVDIIQSRKLIDDGGELFTEVLLGIPNLAHIKLSNAGEHIPCEQQSASAFECGTGLCQ